MRRARTHRRGEPARLRTLAVAAVAALLAAPLAACSSGASEQPDEFHVRLDRVWQRSPSADASAAPSEALELSRVRAGLVPLLEEVPELAPAETGGAHEALALQVWFSEHEPAPLLPPPELPMSMVPANGARELLLVAELEVPERLRRAVGESRVSARVLLERDASGSLPTLEGDVLLAAKRAFEVIGARLALARGDDGVVERLLADEDPELLLLALEWIRDRRPKIHTDAVVKLLSHADARVSRLAVESLGVVGDARHSREIVKRVQLGDPDHTREVYRSLAALGGAEAVDFLEFAAVNEDDPVLRREAERAYSTARTTNPNSRARGGARAVSHFARGHRQ